MQKPDDTDETPILEENPKREDPIEPTPVDEPGAASAAGQNF